MKYKIKRLAETIAEIFKNKTVGHCLRINDLPEKECYDLCEHLSVFSNFKSFVIVPKNNNISSHQITLDAAIELRNKKTDSLCLIFPPGIDVPASLSNTFEVFDLLDFMRNLENEILRLLDSNINILVKEIIKQAKSGILGRDLKNEDIIDFLESVLNNPNINEIGNSLWKIGLIPDNRENFIDRIVLNYNCVKELAKPSKPQLTVRQRLENTRLKNGDFLDRLEKFISNYPLYPARLWLKAISENPEFSFEHWEFPLIEKSDLEEIILKKPRRGNDGTLIKSCGDLICEDADSHIIAKCGERKKINVAWKTLPKEPINVGSWLIELIPSREDYGDDESEAELPQVISKPNIKRTKLSLDLDLDDIQTKWVQVRITGMDENGDIIKDKDGNPIEAISERILLEEGESPEEKPKQISYPNFSYGLLDLASKFKGDVSEWNEPLSQGWSTDEELSYFKLQVNETQICRVAVSNILKEIEKKIISNPETQGRYSYDVIDLDNYNSEYLTSKPIFSDKFINIDYVKSFLLKRKDLFNKIKNAYGESGIIEILFKWQEVLTKIKNYAQSYNELLDKIINDSTLSDLDKNDLINESLTIDTFELNIKYNTGDQKVMLLLPTHPHRLLWFASYSILLEDWRTKLLEMNPRKRRNAIDLELISQIQPSNVPFILPSFDYKNTSNWFVFIKNINFFIGLFIPLNCRDWARVSADVVRFLGYDESYTINEIKSEQIRRIFSDYINIDENVKSRGINIGVVNPGSGELIASALSSLLFQNSEREESIPLKRINIAAIADSPLPLDIPSFEKLRQDFYYSEGITDKSSALYPALSYWLTEKSEHTEFPNGNQNIAIYYNAIRPKVSTIKLNEMNETEEISLYGLMNRWMTKVISNRGIYETLFWIPVSKAARYEKHPIDGFLTDYLLNISRSTSTALSFLITDGYDSNLICCLKSSLGPDEKGFIEYLHQQSDWVVTVDRFLGPEIFDSPIDSNISSLSEKYLIDYTPGFNEGLGERLLLSSSWVEQVRSNIIKFLFHSTSINEQQDLNFIIDEILKSIKIYSGNLFFKMFIIDYEMKKALSIAFALKYMKEKKIIDDAFILPFWPDTIIGERQLCDFVIVTSKSDRLIFDLYTVNLLLEDQNDSGPDVLENTRNFIDNMFYGDDEDKVGKVLQRSKFVTQLRYYLKKSFRYGLITEDTRISKIRDLLSKLENGKQVYQIKLNMVNIDLNSSDECELSETIDEINVLTLSAKVLNLIFDVNDFAENLNSENSDIKNNNIVETNSNTILNENIVENEILSSKPIVSNNFPESCNIILGTFNNSEILYKPSTKGAPHSIILGIPGQGKSVTINSILVQLTEQGVGSIVFDFHGQYSSQNNPLMKYCAPNVWDILKDKIPFNPFDLESNDDSANASYSINMHCAAIADIFEYVCELGTIQRHTLYEELKKLYKNKSNVSIEDLKRRLKQAENNSNVRNLLARTSKLLEMNFFDQSNKWDLLQATKKGLILNLKTLGEGTIQNAVSAFVLRKIYKDILKWDETNELKLAIVLDEAHRLSKDVTLPLIMQEARKFGVMVVIASQNINHFHPNVIGNAGTKIIYRTNAPASAQVASLITMRPGKEPRKIIENLKVGNAIVQTPEMKFAEVVQMKMFK